MFSKSQFDKTIVSFSTYLADNKILEDFLLFEIQDAWSHNWDIEALNFQEMYAKSLYSTISNRLWRSTAYEPKEILCLMIEKDKELVRSMFKDLFDEQKAVDGRTDRFLTNMQTFYDYLKPNITTKSITGHYHDKEMVSLYLMLSNPLKYCYFNDALFMKAMFILGAKNNKTVVGIESYHKLCSLVTRFLYESESVKYHLSNRLSDRKINHYPSNALAFLYFKWLVELSKK